MATCESLRLETLKSKSKFRIKTEEENGTGVFSYEFEVVEPGEHPICVITEKNKRGKIVGRGLGILEGTGSWTTRNQNPVQTQDRAFTIGHGGVRVGGLICVLHPQTRTRYMFEFPCSRIVLRDTPEA